MSTLTFIGLKYILGQLVDARYSITIVHTPKYVLDAFARPFVLAECPHLSIAARGAFTNLIARVCFRSVCTFTKGHISLDHITTYVVESVIADLLKSSRMMASETINHLQGWGALRYCVRKVGAYRVLTKRSPPYNTKGSPRGW